MSDHVFFLNLIIKLSPYLSFISFSYFNLHVLGDDALIT